MLKKLLIQSYMIALCILRKERVSHDKYSTLMEGFILFSFEFLDEYFYFYYESLFLHKVIEICK